uniref:Uncharacterized protein n=1 Tax=Onchocerca volvulus TaxID=6282 RepID=A0A2K6WIJ2_ONCVO
MGNKKDNEEFSRKTFERTMGDRSSDNEEDIFRSFIASYRDQEDGKNQLLQCC